MSSADLRYPRQTLLADYGRATAGVLLCGAPLAAARRQSLAGADPAAGFLLFAVFLARTALRHHTRYVLGPDTLCADGPAGTAGRMEPARPAEAQLFLDQARSHRRLDAAQPSARPAAARSSSIPRSTASMMSSSARRSAAETAGLPLARRRAPISRRWASRWRVRKRRYERSAAGRESDRRVRRPRGHAARRRQRLVLPSRPAARWRWSANRARASRCAARPSWACCRAPRRSPSGSILFDDPRDQRRRPIDIAKLDRDGPRDAHDPRRRDLDHLPGADDLAVGAAHGRRPDRRGGRAAWRRRLSATSIRSATRSTKRRSVRPAS